MKTKAWLKIKTCNVIHGVIAGFITDEDKGRDGFSSLIIAQEKTRNKYVGQVGPEILALQGELTIHLLPSGEKLTCFSLSNFVCRKLCK